MRGAAGAGIRRRFLETDPRGDDAVARCRVDVDRPQCFVDPSSDDRCVRLGIRPGDSRARRIRCRRPRAARAVDPARDRARSGPASSPRRTAASTPRSRRGRAITAPITLSRGDSSVCSIGPGVDSAGAGSLVASLTISAPLPDSGRNCGRPCCAATNMRTAKTPATVTRDRKTRTTREPPTRRSPETGASARDMPPP